jgi:hypothetical protein
MYDKELALEIIGYLPKQLIEQFLKPRRSPKYDVMMMIGPDEKSY